MFTGIVDDVGTIERVADADAGRELRVLTAYRDLVPGESIALNGACLTVREHGTGWFTVAAVGTTLERTTIGSWSAGRRINLERALRLGDRLGGHLVQGHVDGVARIAGVRRDRDAVRAVLALPGALAVLMVPHGSIAVDGVSLTVNDVPAPEQVELSIIEYTARQTTLGWLEEGDTVHIEADVIAKHVQRLFAAHHAPNH